MARVPSGKKGGNLIVAFAGLATIAFVLAFATFASGPVDREPPSFGATFSTLYARQLGLDPREAFAAVVGDLGVRRVRLPVYWPDVQPTEGEFRWEETDWLMDEAARRGVAVTLAVGLKVPRWPECHLPDWAANDDGSPDRSALLKFLRAAVERYRASAALARWQVENEPYLAYGVCPETTEDEVGEEIALVRSVDPAHPVVMTVSGELQRWGPTARQADLLGYSVYRETWNRYVGRVRYPLPPAFYRLRARLAGKEDAFVSELQAEPWFSEPVENRTPAEWAATFDVEDLRRNVEFATRIGVPEVDLWGVEWWYYLREMGEPELWEEGERTFGGEGNR